MRMPESRKSSAVRGPREPSSSQVEAYERRQKQLRKELTRRGFRELCRADINAATEYFFGVNQEPLHEEWQNIWATHRQSSTDAPIEHGKTFQASIALPLWKLGNDHFENIAIIGNATENPQACLEVITNQINDNPRVHEIFPTLEIVKQKQEFIRVKRGLTTDKEPSIAAIGVAGSIIGKRYSGIVLDDIQDFDNTYSETERQKLWTRLESTIMGRLIQSGWLVDIGTPWHLEDARHRLRRRPDVEFFRYDAMDNLWPHSFTDPKTGKVYGWPRWRLDEKQEVMTQMEFDRQFRCIASAGSIRIFKEDYLQVGLDLGKDIQMGRGASLGHNSVVVTGVDLAITRRQTGDRTVLFTGEVESGVKYPLDIAVGRWEIEEIIRQMLHVLDMYPNHRGFLVETNAGQDYLYQVLGNTEMLKAIGATEYHLNRLRVESFVTDHKKKLDEQTGIRSMSVDFRQGKFAIPCDKNQVMSEHVHEWYDSMISFDPLSHTNDILMACWLFSEQARGFWTYDTGDLWDRFGVM